MAAFTSSVSSTICGDFVYTITDSSDANLNSNIFTVTSFTVSYYTADTTYAGNTYSVKVMGYQGSYSSNYITMTFNVNIQISCTYTVITAASN